MGGGGLVILKHKSWNVWNKDNIDKVKKDEAENEAKQAAKDEKRIQAEGEIRYEQLRGNKLTKEEQEQRIQKAIDSADPNQALTLEDVAKKRSDEIAIRDDEDGPRQRRKTDRGAVKVSEISSGQTVDEHKSFFANAVGLPMTMEKEANVERLAEEKKEEKEANDRYTMYLGQSGTKEMQPWYVRSEQEREGILALPASQVQRPGMKRFYSKYKKLEDREVINKKRQLELDPLEHMQEMMYGPPVTKKRPALNSKIRRNLDYRKTTSVLGNIVPHRKRERRRKNVRKSSPSPPIVPQVRTKGEAISVVKDSSSDEWVTDYGEDVEVVTSEDSEARKKRKKKRKKKKRRKKEKKKAKKRRKKAMMMEVMKEEALRREKMSRARKERESFPSYVPGSYSGRSRRRRLNKGDKDVPRSAPSRQRRRKHS